MGRPRFVLTDEHIRQVEQLAGLGLSLEKIAAVIGTTRETLTKRKKEEARVFRALEEGKAKAEGVVGKALFVRAQAGDVSAIRWWEMTRAGRTEEQRRTMAGDNNNPIVMKIGWEE